MESTNWIVRYYKGQKEVSSKIIKDRNEIEASNEAMADMPRNASDWTMMPVLFDKNYNPIEIGNHVDVPEPNDSDAHNFEFTGYVESFEFDGGYVVVTDGDGDAFMIEAERLEINND